MGQLMTRRRLLWLGGATAVMAGLPLRVGAARAAAPSPWLRRSGYAGRIGETFRVALPGGGSLALRLAAVGDLQRAAGHEHAFCVTLRGPRSPALSQGVHGLSHPELGRAALFLVPGEPGTPEASYQLVVNRAAG